MSKSDASALDRLREHLYRLTNRVIEDVESGLHSGSPEAVAHTRESTLRAVLSRFFPPSYELAKGKMYDVHGGVSDSLDVVVLAPNHPKLRNELGAHEILLADGVQCAIELKPDLSDLPEGFGVDRRQKPEIIRALEQVRSVKRLRRERAGVLVGFEPELSAAYTEHVHRLPCHLVTAKAAPVDLCSYVASYYVKHNVPLVEQVDMVLVLGQALLVNTKAPEHGFQPSSSETWFSSIVALDYQKDALAGFVVRLMAEVGPELTMSTPVLCTYLGKIPPPRVLAGFVNTVSGSVFNAVGNATGNPVPALTAAAGKLGPRSDQNG